MNSLCIVSPLMSFLIYFDLYVFLHLLVSFAHEQAMMLFLFWEWIAACSTDGQSRKWELKFKRWSSYMYIYIALGTLGGEVAMLEGLIGERS